MIHIPYEFDPGTVNLILRGLGKLPYDEVATTITQIRQHAAGEIARVEAEAKATATAEARAAVEADSKPAPAAKRTRKKA